MKSNRIYALQFCGFVAFGALYPWLFPSDYLIHLASLVLLYIVLTSSLNLIIGYTGQFALAHAAFYGVGAYASVLLVIRLGVPFWAAWAGGILLAGIFALVIGLLTLHLKGAYLAICTFAFSELFRLTLDNWVSLTNGANGIIVKFTPTPIGIPGLVLWRFESRRSYYYFFLFLAAATLWFIYRTVSSNLGRVLRAIRQDEMLALTAGFHTMRYKVFAFVTGSMLAAVAGASYAPYLSFIAPDLFDMNETIYIMMVMMIGGIRTIAGPVWGSIVLVSLPQILEIKPFIRMIIYGLVLIIIMVRLPGGLAQIVEVLIGSLGWARVRGEKEVAEEPSSGE